VSKLVSKVAVITGGAKKIGRATAIELAKQGYNILIHTGGSSVEEAKETIQLIKKHSVDASLVIGDLREEKTVQEIKLCAEKMGTVLILVNNASLRIASEFQKIKIEDWKKIMSINVDAAFLCSQAFIGSMIKYGWGRIINLGGLSAHIGACDRAHVVTSKAAIVGLTKAIAIEFVGTGVTCNCVVPGFIEDFNTDKKELRGHWLKHPLKPQLPMGKFGTPDDIAKTISYLCKKDADYITAQVVHVNGGTYIPS
jgi:3-oxoacyl-[acyl-carrier protein] reductase|tara:strand:+ start:3232 stop:3993 length:762 start_codon:yes stop_codon:yes gene_type:complete